MEENLGKTEGELHLKDTTDNLEEQPKMPDPTRDKPQKPSMA